MHSSPAVRPGDIRAVDDLDALARWMDSAIEVPGTKFRVGFDALLGLLPGVGDAAGALVASYILLRAHRAGVSRATLARMGANVALDAAVGAVPIVGDLFDMAFKANRRNVDLLKKRLQAESSQAKSLRRADRAFVAILLAGLVALVVGAVLATWVLVRALVALLA